ncbi:MAG TPA: GerMN domain-containing protein [Actinomycetes bacterium]|nr:GerMN domain-containing protein [Actinomycetes bacterium]
MSRARAWLAAGLLCLVAGCGVPADPAPRSIPAEDVPFGLLGTTTTTTRPTPSTRAVVYLVDGGRLTPVRREVPAPVTPAAVLAAVAAGPTPAEVATGLRSALVTEATLAQVTAGTATVRLDRDFVAADIGEQVLALAQLVYSITELPGIGGVQFTLDGQPAEIPTAQGPSKTGAATRADFAAVGPAG